MIVMALCLLHKGITNSFYHIYCKTDLNLNGGKKRGILSEGIRQRGLLAHVSYYTRENKLKGQLNSYSIALFQNNQQSMQHKHGGERDWKES